MALQLPDDFDEFLRLLNANRVEYLVVGGYAVGYHGHLRATNDLDIWVAMSPVNAARLVRVVRQFGFQVKTLRAELFLEEDQIVRMGESPLRIEVMTSLSGVKFHECYVTRVSARMGRRRVKVIGLPQLLRNKRASGRLKDLDDVEHLEARES